MIADCSDRAEFWRPPSFRLCRRFTLVLGGRIWVRQPAPPGCGVAARVIDLHPRACGFDVTERTDASNGVLRAALFDLAPAELFPGIGPRGLACCRALAAPGAARTAHIMRPRERAALMRFLPRG
jgi:hypothetical protein